MLCMLPWWDPGFRCPCSGESWWRMWMSFSKWSRPRLEHGEATAAKELFILAAVAPFTASSIAVPFAYAPGASLRKEGYVRASLPEETSKIHQNTKTAALHTSMLKLSRSLMIFSTVYGGEGREVHLLVLNLLKSLAEQALWRSNCWLWELLAALRDLSESRQYDSRNCRVFSWLCQMMEIGFAIYWQQHHAQGFAQQLTCAWAATWFLWVLTGRALERCIRISLLLLVWDWWLLPSGDGDHEKVQVEMDTGVASVCLWVPSPKGACRHEREYRAWSSSQEMPQEAFPCESWKALYQGQRHLHWGPGGRAC